MPDLTPPPELTGPTRALWDRTVTRLTELNRADRTDPAILRAYVEAVTRHNRAAALLQATDVLLERDGQAIPSPALPIVDTASRAVANLSRALGLNSRPVRVGPVQPVQPMRVPPFEGAWRCDDPEHNWWHGTCHKHGGEACHGKVPAGLTTCRMHAGRGAKQKHLAAVAARQRTGGTPIATHPAEALMQEVAYWTGLCAWLDDIVGRLEQEQAVWGMVSRSHTEGFQAGTTVVNQAGLNVWVRWQQDAHQRKAAVAKMALDAEVDQAALRWQQAQGMQAFRVMERALDVAGLDAGQWARVREAMPGLIRDLIGQQATAEVVAG